MSFDNPFDINVKKTNLENITDQYKKNIELGFESALTLTINYTLEMISHNADIVNSNASVLNILIQEIKTLREEINELKAINSDLNNLNETKIKADFQKLDPETREKGLEQFKRLFDQKKVIHES